MALRCGSMVAVVTLVGAAAIAQPGVTMIPQGIFYSTEANAISPNGRFIIGFSIGLGTGINQFRADRQTPPLEAISLLDAPGTVAWPVSVVLDNGSILGHYRPDSGTFDSLGGLTPSAPGAGTLVSQASISPATRFKDIVASPDGTLIAATTHNDSGFSRAGQIFYTPGAGGSISFSQLPVPMVSTLAAGRTLAGLPVIVGLDDQNRVIRYAPSTGIATVVTTAPFTITASSQDGRVLAGFGVDGPKRWSADRGVEPLGLAGLNFVKPTAISADGTTIVGIGVRPGGPSVNGISDAIVWRDGALAANIWSIVPEPIAGVSQTGITWLSGLTPDGSTVVGALDTEPLATAFDTDRAFFAVLPPGRGETCSNPIPVTYGTTFASTRGANRSASQPGAGVTCTINEAAAPDIFFTFVPAANETVVIDTCGSDFDTTLAMTTLPGGCGSGGTGVACNDDAVPACTTGLASNSRMSANVFAGQAYWIRVSGWNGNKGAVRLNITAPNRPANDLCSTATPIQVGHTLPFNLAGAITDTSPPNTPCTLTLSSDVWFSCTAQQAGSLTFDTCGSGANMGINVYDGSACVFSQSPIRCSTVGCTTGGASVTVPCTAGQSFLIRVGGLFGAVVSGNFTARFTCDTSAFDAYRSAVLADNPLGFWRFNDSGDITAADQRQTLAASTQCGDYPGEYTGNPGRAQYGLWGTGLQLAGNGAGIDYINAPPPASGNSCGPTGSWTIEGWVKTTASEAGVLMTQRQIPSDNSPTLLIGYTPSGIPRPGRVMLVNDGPGQFSGAISTRRVDDGRWHHIVGVREFIVFQGWFYRVYVDGVLEGTNNLLMFGGLTPAAPNIASAWVIGKCPAWAPGGAPFNGQLDEVALYCNALPPARIGEHWRIGRRWCNPADLVGLGGVPQPDGVITPDDLVRFLDAFFNNNLITADIATVGGTLGPDGQLTADDVVVFLQQFFAGCP
ncbi:MAG: LamG-like jellyroll fold domain-containing protein [Phycisphaerales bacterium]